MHLTSPPPNSWRSRLSRRPIARLTDAVLGLIDVIVVYMCTDLCFFGIKCVKITAMKPRKISVSDVCELTGYTRNQLRGLLRDMPSFVCHEPLPRSGRTFTRGELVVLCVITEMEATYGMRRASIGTVLQPLLSAIQTPRSPGRKSVLNVVMVSQTVLHLDSPNFATEGLIVPLEPIYERIEKYLGAHPDSDQIELALGPVMVAHRNH